MKEMVIGGRTFALGNHTYLVGILNVTPDSFSDGGSFDRLEEAVQHTGTLLAGGADVIDIGGESTRPGYTAVSGQEEIARIVPVIRQIKKQWDCPVSADTYKAKVAEAAVEAGADWINDIWGLKKDPGMASVVKSSGLPVCIMHNREKAEDGLSEEAFLQRTFQEVEQSLAIAKKAGIAEDKLVVDPGIGFGKTYEQNLICLRRLREFKRWGYPVLLGASRKSVIGLTLKLPVDEREEGTMALSVLAAMQGCDFVRVHDTEGNRRVIQMTEAVRQGCF